MCNSILETVAAHASEHPQLRCMAEMNKICTYGELWAQILHNAACLKKHGVEKGDRVILHSSQTIWHAAALLAIHLVGGVAVPVEKKIALDRMTEIAQSVEAKLVVAPRKLEMEYPVLTRADLEAFEAEDDFSYAFPHREDMCDILFTTGTTGKSKGVIRTHANELACAQSVAAYGDLDENEVALVPFPLNHSGGIGRLYACLIAKTLMIPTDGVVFVQTFYSLMDKYGVTIMFLAPAHLSILLNRSEEHLKTYDGKLRMVTIGSSYLDEATRQRLLTVLPNVKLYITYGATESSSACSFEFSKYRNKPRCIGLPNVNTKILITDENGVEIKGANAQNPGFIAHDGPTVVPGYWKEPELTASVIKNGRLAACLGLAKALEAAGGTELISQAFQTMIGSDINPYLLFCILVFLVQFTSEFISNSTAILIVLPIALSIAPQMGLNTYAFALGVTLASGVSISCPLASSTLGMSMVVGYRFNDYFKYGFLLDVIFYILIVTLVPLFVGLTV